MSSHSPVTPTVPKEPRFVIPKDRSRPSSKEALPPWAVMLHDDEVNEMGFVCEVLCAVTALNLPTAFTVMLKAHRHGESVVTRTHREYGELLAERLIDEGLCVSLRKL